MRKLEQQIYSKLRHDFPKEIDALENGMNTLVKYGALVDEISPYHGGLHTIQEMLKASVADKCLTVQIMLLNNAVTNMKASRMLLLTGYLMPAMAILRIAFEAFHNAHICSAVEKQAENFLNGKSINKKVDIDFPIQLLNEKVKRIKNILSEFGVHSSYKGFENQGLFEASVLQDEHKITYEFLVYRCLFSYLSVLLDLLAYYTGQWPGLAKNVPDILDVAKDVKKAMEKSLKAVEDRAVP